MAFPIIALIASILGRKEDKPEAYRMGTIRESVQPGTRRTWDNNTMSYTDTGSANGEVQPGQRRFYNQGTGTYQNAPSQQQSGGGFQNALGKVQTIASILDTLKNRNQSTNTPYQMQINRRY